MTVNNDDLNKFETQLKADEPVDSSGFLIFDKDFEVMFNFNFKGWCFEFLEVKFSGVLKEVVGRYTILEFEELFNFDEQTLSFNGEVYKLQNIKFLEE